MWKKEPVINTSNNNNMPAEPIREWESDAPSRSKKVSILGNAVQLEGVLRGEDDVVLNGKLRGRIELPKNALTIGLEGCLEGEILAEVVTVEGAVKGDIKASERVILRRTAQILGNISCEKIIMEEGARVNGAIDMSAPEQMTRVAAQAPETDDVEESALAH